MTSQCLKSKIKVFMEYKALYYPAPVLPTVVEIFNPLLSHPYFFVP